MKENSHRRRDKREKDFDHSLLHVARVARVVQGGRRFSFRATVAIGDRKGKVGVGVAKGSDVSLAIGKAIHDAKKHLVSFVRRGSTIPHEIDFKYESARIILKPAKEGKGIVAGGALRILADLGGIKDLTAKSLGSNNKINTAKAMLGALKNLKNTEKSQTIEGKKTETESKKIEGETQVEKPAEPIKEENKSKSKKQER
mgnify:CR=1 FL=1